MQTLCSMFLTRFKTASAALLPVVTLTLTFSTVARADSENPNECQPQSQECVRSAMQKYARANKTNLGYDGARLVMFQKVDSYFDSQGKRVVKSVYSDDVFTLTEGIPKNGVNTEHTWPQTKLRAAGTIDEGKSDLYHLFPSEIRINGLRGSFPFKDCHHSSDTQGYLCQGSGFEPPEGHKGVVARAMFYMSVLYSMRIDESQEKTLREWSSTHPVQNSEVERAEKIKAAQGNRNPFIDHPEWVELIKDF
ncbi:MAG: hypothetical protein RIR26_464 [Pseudomonadota bacterium]|jgi:endonuclease I